MLSVKTLEAGSYDLVVTVTPTDRPALPPYTKNVVVQPKKIPRPTIESLKAMQDDRHGDVRLERRVGDRGPVRPPDRRRRDRAVDERGTWR